MKPEFIVLNEAYREMMKEDLRLGECEVTFKKKDGTETTRTFTLKPELIESIVGPEIESESVRKVNPDVCTVFQTIGETGWRSFRWENLISYSLLT